MPANYTCISHLLAIESERHLVNLAVERSGAELSDADVLAKLVEVIASASRDWDGYVRAHTPVPLEATVTALAGTLALTNGSRDVVGTGTLFLSELSEGDWIRADSEPDAVAVVKSVTDDTNLILQAAHYGTTAAAASASIYDCGLPAEVEILVRDHVAYMLWARRGRLEGDNPHDGRERMFMARVRDVQRGKYRFETAGGAEVAEKPVGYDDTAAVMTDDSMDGFMGEW